jgi:hypothetical protein
MKVFDLQENKEVEVPDTELSEAVNSGRFALPKNTKIEVTSPDGERGTIDSLEAPDAFKKGFKFVPPDVVKDELLQQEYGEGIGNELKAAGLATARGLTFGGSDQLLEKTGLVSQEALRELKERNPVASFAGEVVGTVGPALASGGTSLLAKGAAKSLPALAMKVSEKAGGAVAKSLAKESTSKIVQNAVKMGVGSAVEGSLYGAGQLVSEEALGSADFNAESVIATVGLNTVLGGGLGVALGGGAALGSKYLTKIKADIKRGDLSKYGVGKKQAADLVDNINLAQSTSELSEVAKDINPNMLARESKDVNAIQEASDFLEITPTRGMLSEDKTFQNLESTLVKSDMMAGQDVKQATINVREGLEKATEDVLSKGKGVGAVDEGEAIKQSIFEHYNSRLSTYKSFQDTFESEFGNVAINERMVKLAETRFLKQADNAFDDTNIQKAVAGIRKIDSVSKAKQAKKYFWNEAQKAKRTGDNLAQSVFMDAYDTSQRMIENAAISSVNGVRNKKRLVEGIRAANKTYASLASDMKDVAKLLGKKINRPSEMVDFVENSLDAKQLTEKISKIKNNDLLDTLEKKLPDVYESAMRFKAAKILKSSQDDYGNVIPKKFLSQIKKMDEDEIKRLFGDKVKKIDAIKTVSDALPTDINPSGTAQATETLGLFSLGNQGKALALRGLYSDGGQKLVDYYGKILGTLRGVENSSNTIKTSIADSVEAFIKSSSRATVPTLSAGDVGKEFLIAKEKIEEIEGSPEVQVEKFADANSDLFDSAPGTAAMISGKLSSAVQFLSQKLPRRPVTSPFMKLEPTTREKEKFLRYYNAAQNPKAVFEDLKKGYANPEGVEVLKRVYPEIYRLLSEEVMNRIEEKSLSYQDRINLQKLLGISANYKKPRIQRNPSQATQSQSTPNLPNANRGRLGGIKTIDRGGRFATKLEGVMSK